MAVFGMPKPKPSPGFTAPPGMPNRPINSADEVKPGYGSYTKPDPRQVKPPNQSKPVLPPAPVTTPTPTPSPAGYQPFEYTPNADGSPLSFQQQLQQLLVARGAGQQQAAQHVGLPTGPSPDSGRMGFQQNSPQNTPRSFANATMGYGPKPSQDAYAKPIGYKPPNDYSKPAPVGPGYAGAEVGFQGQATPPPEQTTPIGPPLSGGAYSGGFGFGGGGGGGALARALGDYLGNYRRAAERLPYIRNTGY